MAAPQLPPDDLKTDGPAPAAPAASPIVSLPQRRPQPALRFRGAIRPKLADEVLSFAVGLVFAGLLFVAMALAQMMGDVKRPEQRIEERIVQFHAPEVEEIEEEEPPAVEEEPPPPAADLAERPPSLSLDQLDIALNPGTGSGSLVGDFSLESLGSIHGGPALVDGQEFVDFVDLDQTPRPIGASLQPFPRRLLRKKVDGRIVVFLKLDASGHVVDVRIARSNLPDFEQHVLDRVRSWQFTPPTQQGKPVNAQAELPIPIRIL